MAAPTFYRHRNEDTFKHEIVVRAFVPGQGDLWGFTVTDVEAAFESWVTVHVHTGQFEVYARFPQFFAALAARKPGTLDEVAGLLDEFGIADDTDGYERRRAQVHAAAVVYEKDPWPYL